MIFCYLGVFTFLMIVKIKRLVIHNIHHNLINDWLSTLVSLRNLKLVNSDVNCQGFISHWTMDQIIYYPFNAWFLSKYEIMCCTYNKYIYYQIHQQMTILPK